MNIQMLTKSSNLAKPIEDFFVKKGDTLFSSSSLNEFFRSCTENPSPVFIIQSNVDTDTQMLDFIKDLRTYFGAFPLIFIMGEKEDLGNSTNFLNVGASSILDFPFDGAIFEDFLSHRLQRESFLPIHYRNVPSGGSPGTMTRPIHLTQLSSEGLEFHTADFITRGTIFDFKIEKYLPLSTSQVKCKVISSRKDLEEDTYHYQVEYFEISSDLRKEIRFALKK